MIASLFRLAENRILVEQLRLIMGNFRSTWPSMVIALLFLWPLSTDQNALALRCWCVGVIVSNLNLQFYVRRKLARGLVPGDARGTAVALGLLNAVDGLLWGLLPWLTLGLVGQTGFVLVIAAYCGMVAAAVATQSPVLPQFLAFTLPQFASFALKLWLLGDPAYGALAIAAVLYYIAMAGQAINSSRAARAAIDVRFELADSHARLREIERRQTLAEERQRLVQDMHDGLGSSLLGALRVVEHGRLAEIDIAQVLKSCIDDLKLAIDSLEPVDADLLLLLATLRFRLGTRLESSGIALSWQVRPVPTLEWLDPRTSLHILRILQEAIANIIKHAGATEVRVETRADADNVYVLVSDNGRGFDLEHMLERESGKGLTSQMRRARAIAADISWSQPGKGTCVTLRLPIRQGHSG